MSSERHWTGVWISSGEDGPAAPLLRGEVIVPPGTVRGVLHVAGLGLHVTTLDGVRVTGAELESGTRAFDRRIPYSSYPVRPTPGPAVIGVELGRGFYAMTTPNVWGWHEAPWRGLRMARVDLELFDADDAVIDVIGSDLTWRWASGGTRVDSFYEGETFDARAEPQGWDVVGFDASSWLPVHPATPPPGVLEQRRRPPIEVQASHPPLRWLGGDGAPWIADFGTQLSGWVRVEIPDAAPGTRITLRYAETVADGRVVAENEHVFSDRFATDEFVLSEQRRHWQPRFSYQGFRFVQVEGIRDPSEIVMTAQHAHAAVAEVSRFSCSDEVLTWIDRAMRLTVRNNLHHQPTDTPLYEKNGWLGDAQVALEAMLHQFDLQTFMSGWAEDVADTEDGAGRLACIAPTPGWGYLQAPEWTTLYPYLLSRLRTWYGDEALPPGCRQVVVRHLEHELSQLEGGLATGTLGDYLAPGSMGTPPADDLRIAASCYLVRGLRLGAELVADDDDLAPAARRFRAAADELAERINDTFLDREESCYRSEREPSYRATSSILPLAFGITPADDVPAVVERLAAELRARGDRHDSGCLGLSELFEVLSVHGHADLAVAVASGRSAPSWGAWMDAGATTMWEMWGPAQRSLDHYFMGAMARWLYERVAGVRMTASRWSAFDVDPVARGDLEHASFFLDGPHGELGASWTREDDGLRLRVIVPPQTTATIHLRGREPLEVGPGEWDLTEDPGDDAPQDARAVARVR